MLILDILLVAGAYCLGSISTAYVVGRLARGVDMTEVGTGRIGATYTARRLGFVWGAVVGVGDVVKAMAAVALPLALGVPTVVVCLCALAAVAGHNWSVFLGFKGGRGAAASFGALLVFTLWAFLIPSAVFLVLLYAGRRTEFVFGIRRSTVLFGLLMFSTSALVLLQLAAGFPPPAPWSTTSPLMVAVPPLMLTLNVLGGWRKPDK